MTREIPDAWRCTGENKDGSRCSQYRDDGFDTCWRHRPGYQIPDGKRCTAKITGGQTNKDHAGERCTNWRMKNQAVCRTHGGNARQSIAAAKRRAEIEEAKAMVATYGLPREISPEAAILEEIHRTAGHVAWLEDQIRGLDADQLIWGVTREKEGGEDRGITFEAVPHAYLKLYQTERAHLAKVSADAIRCGIEERRVKLAEQQGQLVAQAVRGILDDLKLTAAQRAMIPDIVPKHLRALALTN